MPVWPKQLTDERRSPHRIGCDRARRSRVVISTAAAGQIPDAWEWLFLVSSLVALIISGIATIPGRTGSDLNEVIG